MAVAARLAKLGHGVVVFERDPDLGGSLRPLRQDGFTWDRGRATLTLPAVLRDLFRKSGRPLDRVLELQPVRPGRRHVFADRSVLDLPMGTRMEQVDALTAAFDGRAADLWSGYVDRLAPVWDVVRRRLLENPFEGRRAIAAAEWKTLQVRRSLRRGLRQAGRSAAQDERLSALLLDRHRLAGQDPGALPALFGVVEYVERSFGRWRVVGGLSALVAALTDRLDERGVEVRTETAVEDVALRDGVACGIVLADGSVEEVDVVVWTAPRRPPALNTGRPLASATPPARTYLGLSGPVPALPTETFLHGRPLAVVRIGGVAPEGLHAWSVEHRPGSEDVLVSLAHRGIDVRHLVVTRIDRSPAQIVGSRGASPVGVAWSGWRTVIRRERPQVANVPGLFRLGPDVHPGPGLVLGGLGAAQVATVIGKA